MNNQCVVGIRVGENGECIPIVMRLSPPMSQIALPPVSKGDAEEALVRGDYYIKAMGWENMNPPPDRQEKLPL